MHSLFPSCLACCMNKYTGWVYLRRVTVQIPGIWDWYWDWDLLSRFVFYFL